MSKNNLIGITLGITPNWGIHFFTSSSLDFVILFIEGKEAEARLKSTIKMVVCLLLRLLVIILWHCFTAKGNQV